MFVSEVIEKKAIHWPGKKARLSAYLLRDNECRY